MFTSVSCHQAVSAAVGLSASESLIHLFTGNFKIRKGKNLGTWLEEMKLWDRAFAEDKHALQNYLKFRDMVKDTEIHKFVQTKQVRKN